MPKSKNLGSLIIRYAKKHTVTYANAAHQIRPKNAKDVTVERALQWAARKGDPKNVR